MCDGSAGADTGAASGGDGGSAGADTVTASGGDRLHAAGGVLRGAGPRRGEQRGGEDQRSNVRAVAVLMVIGSDAGDPTVAGRWSCGGGSCEGPGRLQPAPGCHLGDEVRNRHPPERLRHQGAARRASIPGRRRSRSSRHPRRRAATTSGDRSVHQASSRRSYRGGAARAPIRRSRSRFGRSSTSST